MGVVDSWNLLQFALGEPSTVSDVFGLWGCDNVEKVIPCKDFFEDSSGGYWQGDPRDSVIHPYKRSRHDYPYSDSLDPVNRALENWAVLHKYAPDCEDTECTSWFRDGRCVNGRLKFGKSGWDINTRQDSQLRIVFPDRTFAGCEVRITRICKCDTGAVAGFSLEAN